MTPSAQPESGHFFRDGKLGWFALLVAALLFMAWVNHLRLERVRHVTNTAGWSVDAPGEDARSPTGYADRTRKLIVPGHHNPSYHWIVQTQAMLTDPAWQRHHVAYENHPAGRPSTDTSLYRWWLGAVAWADHLLTSRSLPLAVEHGTLYADPMLHGVMIVSVAAFTGCLSGAPAAALVATILVLLFPFAGNFQPGAPHHRTLAWLFALWSLLPLIAGFLHGRRRLWFALGGIAGGLTLWTDHFIGEAVVAGLGLGATGIAFFSRDTPTEPASWRVWGIAGAMTCLIAWLVEFFPVMPDPAVATVHPLHSLAWLGLGELLQRLAAWARFGRATWNRTAIAAASLALMAFAALPVVRSLAENGRFTAEDAFADELVNLPIGVRAASLGSWLVRDGLSLPMAATCLPLLLIAGATWLVVREKLSNGQRSALVLTLMPVLLTAVLACTQLRSWNTCGAMLVALALAVLTAGETLPAIAARWFWRASCLLVVLPGGLLLPPSAPYRGAAPLGEADLQSVLERDLAHWLARQSGSVPAAVFTTPGLSETFAFYGNIPGVASYAPENEIGFTAATRIASASTWTEASALLEGRRITHLVMPSWDPMLEQLALIARRLPADVPLPDNTLTALLRNWTLPPWLQLMTYHTPKEVSAGNYAAVVFAVRPEQDDALAACRLADYFVEMGMMREAQVAREKLRLYPRNLPALAALAQVSQALGDGATHDAALHALLPQLSRRAGRNLPVDRRISLAAVLIQAKQRDAAREQMQLCATELDVERLRSLTTGQIVRLLALNDIFGVTLADPSLRPLALSLLPPSLRDRLLKSGD
jgi:hypothetical protein